MSGHQAADHKHGRKVYRYHPRSDLHSKVLCGFVLEDLIAASPRLAADARQGIVVGKVNARYTFSNQKVKSLDLAVGTPAHPVGADPISPAVDEVIRLAEIGVLRLALEAKQCMTEHSKSKPRLFDELSSSHEIVHQGAPDALACGIVVVNIASQYASPTRQKGRGAVAFTAHRQPIAAASMIEHLRGLMRRSETNSAGVSGPAGFDAFATIVIDCDNVGPCRLETTPPAPQPGDPDEYGRFLDDVSRAYAIRYP